MGNYPKMAEFLSRWRDMNIFRRFGALQAQRILFLQAELAHLEDQLNDIREEEYRNASEDPEKREESELQSQYWRALHDAGEDSEEYIILQEISEKLTEYSTICFS